MEKRVVTLWVCNYRLYFFLLLFLSISIEIQCQVIRKSVELPVKDYLSAPKRNGRDGKDHLYAQVSSIDSFRNFEVLSPHTPASALMFASLAKDSNASPTLLPLSSPVDVPGRKLFKPAVSTSNILSSINREDKVLERLFTREKSPSTELLEDGLNKATKGYSFSFTDPQSENKKESNAQGASQEFIPVYSTPIPLLYQNRDDALGYLNKFSNIFPAAREGIEGRNIDRYFQYVTPTTSQYNVPEFEGQYRPYTQKPHSSPRYNGESEEYYDYSGRYKHYNNPVSSKEGIPTSVVGKGSTDYYEKSHEINNYDRTNNGNYNPKNRQQYDRNQAPYVPPTIGVIGWKSNTDHETTWKPTKALINMADEHIKDDMKHKGQITTTPMPHLKGDTVESDIGQNNNNEDPNQGKDEGEEEEEEEEEGEEEEETEEDEEEEEEEEEEVGEEGEGEEEEEDNTGSEHSNHADGHPPSYETYSEQPSLPPPRYEHSAEGPSNPASYQQENVPPPGPPPRYENSAEHYRDPPSYLPPKYQNSEEYYEEPTLRPPQRYENSPPDSREPPPHTYTDYENSVEHYSPSPTYPPRLDHSADKQQRPLQSSPSYDKSPEYYNSRESNEYQNSNSPPEGTQLPQKSAEYSHDVQTLPPGPPYNPPSYAHDPRSKIGYLLSPSSYQPIPLPIDVGIRQSWTPIIPTAKSANYQETKNAPEYKSDNGRWLLNGGPILKSDFVENPPEFQNWEFGKGRSAHKVEDEIHKQHKKPRDRNIIRDGRNDGRDNIVKREKQDNKRVDSDKLPAEHRGNTQSTEEFPKVANNIEQSSKERDSSEKSSKEETDSDYQSPPPPRDFDEDRVRNHVSDREKPRNVPTRLHYPGGGLWAKPHPDSGIDLGFVPKKVYTQTRKHNVVKHLPREAALQAASTAEEVINAPRLREVVNHKKIQEVYEEEGYEDSGYDHGGYKKHGASKTDTDKYNSGEQHTPADAEESGDPSPEEAFEEHQRHLEEIPDDAKGDPEGEGSAKRLVQVSEKPKVKGSWKQQKTTTNERSLAFLDEQGKGGILTEKHPTRVEGVEGKYLDVNGKRVPIVKAITDNPVKFIDHGNAVSFQRHSPANVKTDEEKEVIYSKGSDHDRNPFISSSGYISQGYLPSREEDSSSLELKHFKSNFKNSHKQPNVNTAPLVNYFESSTSLPQLSGYTSRNNRFSYMTHPEKSINSTINPDSKYLDTSGTSQPTNPFINHYAKPESGKELSEQPIGNPTISSRFPEKYSARFQISQKDNRVLPTLQQGLNTERSYDVSHTLEPQSKERKSRDLTAVGIDEMESDIFNKAFTHPTVALRAIEDQMSLISRGSFDMPIRSRTRNSDVGASKKYKEIVRQSIQTQEEPVDDKKDKINVRLTDEDVNIRHPFLPRDGSGDIKIDYVKIRKDYDSTTSPPLRQYFVQDVELASVTEEPTTTTTHRVTTAKSDTTTEYVPEDPSQTLSRLKSNPFLSSIFQSQENQGESVTSFENVQTTTTPKVTTYRAKTTTEKAGVQESPEDTIHRLQNNPFLSSLLSSKEEENKNERKPQMQLRRGSKIRPIVVLPEEPDMKSDSVKHVEQLTLAHYSGPSHGLMYQQVPRRTQQRISNLARHLNSDGVDPMHIIVRRSADVASPDTEKINVAASGTTTEIPVDTEKYPFYYSPASVNFPKYSPLRYAISPKDIPHKTEGGMEFYELRDKSVRCKEPTPPKNIVPKREKDGEWNKSPQPEKQRLGQLGDQIDCLKAKYFGEDPLDNPFFKETDVRVPDFTTHSPDDVFGFNSDIKQNIKLIPESDVRFFGSGNTERGIGTNPKKVAKKDHEKYKHGNKNQSFQKSTLTTKSKRLKFPFNDNPSHLESDFQESRITNKFVSPLTVDNDSNQDKRSKILNQANNESNHTKHTDAINKTIPPFSEIHLGSSGPIRLHPPKNVIISFRSKGTTNHPRIKVIKGTASLYNANVNVVPMSSVGYLKAHTPVHIRVEDFSSDNSHYPLDSLSELDPISSAASHITKQNRMPTTVTYLKMNPDGRLIHQHIRTIIPVPKKPLSENINNSEALKSNTLTTLWDLASRDERKSEPKFRVKRNNENDKYINSKESLELKNFLLQKYAEILAKEKEENNRHKPEDTYNENVNVKTVPISTSRNTEGFAQGIRPQYSSRYRASGQDPMHQSPSTKIKISNASNITQESSHKFSPRTPKVRFPKLTMSSRNASEGNRSKLFNLPEPLPVRLITTRTTTTTEQPPSTTTRMYKPKVVYKKEYGKPIERVVDMFAILKRQPSSGTEHTTTTATTSTEQLPIFSEGTPNSGGRNFKPKRIQQFEHRTITKEEVIRRTYTPESRSDKSRTYDSIYDHPDLRGPISRISRDAEQEAYQEMLVYMVNPMTGKGEWAVMPIQAKAISRIDQPSYPLREQRVDNGIRRRSNTKSRTRLNRENSDLWVDTGESRGEENTTEMDQEMSTSTPRKVKSKTRRKPNSRRQNDKVYLNISQLRNNPSRHSEEVTTPAEAAPPPVTTPDNAAPTTTFDPRIIMEPHKRKYFYAKI